MIDELRRLPREAEDAPCRGARLRVFQGEGLSLPPPAKNPDPRYAEAMPGPTLRASVGDLVQLSFVNKVNSNRFIDPTSLDVDDCVEVGPGGEVYPVGGAGTPRFNDKSPNCLHASSTANIHFHGTHTNPNSTGDNVYLQVRPLPRDSGNLTTQPEEATAGFAEFFTKFTEELQNQLSPWPATWGEVPKRQAGRSWTEKQTELLVAYQQKNPGQRLWDKNKEVLNDSWPIYYIGAFPYCFALPAYTEKHWPPPPGSKSPIMGQAPGTHWYHAHKHGSTAINVANGMTGAFIIEGQYDKDLEDAYRDYLLKGDVEWEVRSQQKVMVLNQLMNDERHPHAMTDRRTLPTPGGVDFSVNGRWRPRVTMQPGEIQLWRIVNTSGRTAAYFMPPQGIEWQQIAQDGVQYAPRSYKDGKNVNKPFYMAPANRVDLLVKAPMSMNGKSADVLIQKVMARSRVLPRPAEPDVEATILLSVDVTDQPVTLNDQATEMPFLTEANAPTLPPFLTDISDEEWKRGNAITRTFVFNSKKPATTPSAASMARQHTINDIQFDEEHSRIDVLLGATEEWIVKNMTNDVTGPARSRIDHPLHIHINPFQVTEFFDPYETFVASGQLVDRYVLVNNSTRNTTTLTDGQCPLNVDDEATWKPCKDTRIDNWWDVFAIPAGRAKDANEDPILNSKGERVVIPGYFKMRSRFVDFSGLYVTHCHILIHEDRGMMFRVEVLKGKPAPATVRHH